jgi:hypothetical protein
VCTKKKRKRLESEEVTCEYSTDIESEGKKELGIEHSKNRVTDSLYVPKYHVHSLEKMTEVAEEYQTRQWESREYLLMLYSDTLQE